MREREKGDLIIDVCPQCQGIFLDHGEMEKLVAIEEKVYQRHGWRYDDDDDDDFDERRPRESRGYAPQQQGYAPQQQGSGDRRAAGYDSRSQQPYPKKKKGFLSTVFETFGEGGGED